MTISNLVRRHRLNSLRGSLLAAASALLLPAPVQAQGGDAAQAVVDAATSLLATFSEDQQSALLLPFDPAATPESAVFPRTAGPQGGGGGGGGFVGERFGEAVWSNYPVSDVPRPGVPLGDMTDDQREAAFRLLQTVLSDDGYRKVQEIMGSDQALTDAGTNFASGIDAYTIGIFGTPSATDPWMIEFGGHHLGLNIVLEGADGVMTPTLTGAQPSVYTVDGETVRALAAENDKAFALLDALDDAQRAEAILSYTVGDLVLGPGHWGEEIVPEGLRASEMSEAQRALLLDLISEWTGFLTDAYADPRLQEIAEGLDDTYFAWSGPTTHEEGRNGSSYYRIQGPRVIIEFSPQGVGGDPTNHVHTIYRDPANDYALAVLRQ